MREPVSMIRKSSSPSKSIGGYGEEPGEQWIGIRLVRAAAEGLLPLVILVALTALFWEASVIARIFSLPHGIDLLQRAVLVTAGGGVLAVFIVFLITSVRTLQGVRERHSVNAHLEANITLIVFACSLIVVLLPLLMALTQPQHPAP